MSEGSVFLGRQAAMEDAKFWVIPGPMEATAVFQKGQAAAPEAILAASSYVYPYDEEIAGCPSDTAPVVTLEAPAECTVDWIREQSAAAIEAKAVPVVLGGEPLVALGNAQAVAASSEEFTVLHLGSRCGLAPDGLGASDTSASVIRRIAEFDNCRKIVQVGVRSLSAEESDVIFSDESKVESFFACDLARRDDDSWHEDVVQELSTPVVLSLDLSALDRSTVPSVGCPEPGGMSYWDVLRLLKKVTARRRIAAIDVNDLIPIEGDLTSDYTAARIVHKIMAYMVVAGKMF